MIDLEEIQSRLDQGVASLTDSDDLLREVERLRGNMDAVRAALGNGADESVWPPGLTVAEAVERLRGKADRKGVAKPCTCVHKRTVSGNRCTDCGGAVKPPSATVEAERERAAVVAWLREHGDQRRAVLADRIERGEHRREETK